ncbi:YaaA family protein [Sanguibacter suarezii]|uniref:YaaA family protein n=1 Tax=Sanguibacter suarezii TaxID=60921 RepID=UPI000835948A|nr:peroxide stress protein YaaA [Sanguibacter suarezii]
MLILLPPSEGKTPATAGSPVDLAALSGPSLTRHRATVLRALARASARRDALTTLGVGPSLADDVARNTRLDTEPAAPAAQVYTGVLYAAAGLDDLSPAQAELAAASVRTVSALWGAVSPADAIPAYRLSMGTDLPGVGPLAASWRPLLEAVLAPRASGDVVVDCRSAAYLAAWKPAKGTDWVSVRVLRELDGKRSVVSHNAKHTRGVLTRHLLTREGAEPRSAEDLYKAAHELVGTSLLDATLLEGKHGAATLELVVA